MAVMPVSKGFYVTSGFGPRWGTVHYGTDFGVDGGSGGHPIFAIKSGTVTASGPASGFGQWVNVDHPASNGGGLSVYGHIIPEVSVGQAVVEGQRIGRINPDSNTNGGVAPHLHLEFHRYVWSPPGGDRLDPMKTVLDGAGWPGDKPSQTSTKPETEQVMNIFGVDISNWQPNISVQKIADEGFRFCIIKATEGAGYRDPYLHRHLKAARATNMHIAAYVYVKSDSTPQAHADTLHSHLGDTSVPIAIDVEDGAGSSVAHFKAVRDAIEAKGYRVILTYLPKWYWEKIGKPSLAGLPPLWTSRYPDMNSGHASEIYQRAGTQGWVGYGGLEVAMWQFTSTASVAGHQIDANIYRGTEQSLRALFTGESQEENIFMALSDAEQRELLDKTRRIHHEMTHEFQSLVKDEEGNQSTWRGTLVGLILQVDKKVEAMHQHMLPNVFTAIQMLFKKEKGDADAQ